MFSTMLLTQNGFFYKSKVLRFMKAEQAYFMIVNLNVPGVIPTLELLNFKNLALKITQILPYYH